MKKEEGLETQLWMSLTFKTQGEIYLLFPANVSNSNLVCHTEHIKNLKLKNTSAWIKIFLKIFLLSNHLLRA